MGTIAKDLKNANGRDKSENSAMIGCGQPGDIG
jgi:hypothetical protein